MRPQLTRRHTIRFAARKDANQDEIVKTLRKVGALVHILNQGQIPDLLVGFRRKLFLLECKDGNKVPSARKLRAGQQAFADVWSDFPVFKVESIDDALSAIGAK